MTIMNRRFNISSEAPLAIEQLLPRVQKNILLKSHTTFKIGGRARYFFVAKTEKNLILTIKTTKKIGLPYYILGNGSNVLVSDKGFDGLIIKIKNSKIRILNSKIMAEAGVILRRLAEAAKIAELTGLEWTTGIPGTVGGAIRGNAAAFGYTISDSIQEVKAYDIAKNKIIILEKRDCQFIPKDSIFKRNKNLIILSAVLKLKKGKKEEIKNKIEEYLNYRKKHHPLDLPSAGSIFINQKSCLAAELIEKAGLKGKREGGAQISEKHANFIVNLGKATANDVKKLINLTKKKVKQKFGILLKEEVEYLS